jgi:ribosome-associated toxin RatA of RatAB toxin-antitoxin module
MPNLISAPLSVTLSCLLFLAAPPLHAKPKLQTGDEKKVNAGEVLEYSKKVKGSGVTMGKAIAVIDDVPEAVLYVLLSFDKYKHFLPRVTESRVTKVRGWKTYTVIHTDLPWPVKDVWVYLEVTRSDKPGRVYEVKWRMLNGTMKSYRGSALIEPWVKSGKRTVITYQLLAEPKTAAPDSMISKGVKRVASTIVKKMRLRLKALRKYKKMPKGL